VNLLDWQCGACGVIRKDLSGFTTASPPTCLACPAAASMEILWTRVQVSAWEKPWKYWDERGNEKTFTSIAEVRTYEKDCERRAASGEGNIEVAAQFSMDRSNRLDPVFKRATFKPATRTKSGQRIVVRRGDGVRREHGEG